MSTAPSECTTLEHLSEDTLQRDSHPFPKVMPAVTCYSETEILTQLRKRGAKTLQRVRFRSNRSTIWSLTRRGTTLNLHVAFRDASHELLDAFVCIATAPGTRSKRYRNALRLVREWPALTAAMQAAQSASERQREGPRTSRCAGTDEQRAFLRSMFLYLNREYFSDLLADDLPLRLSDRMVTRLGQLVTTDWGGAPRIVEIAINIDLMLEGNERELVETVAHEMAHGVDFELNGRTGHGASWKHWAEKAGCEPVACTKRDIRRRRRRAMPVTRVPKWPFTGPKRPTRKLLPSDARYGMQLDLFASPDRPEGARR